MVIVGTLWLVVPLLLLQFFPAGSLCADDVSSAWLVWSRAAEAALADALRFSGGPLLSGGLVLGRR